MSLSWLFVTAAAALPLMLGVPHLSFTDAFFETMSGLSTTGSTVINGLDNLPHAVNLWRHALHWLGGMGIIVLAVAILPLLGVGGMQMYRAETPGPVKDAKLTPRITETAKALWLVYAGITAACIASLVAGRACRPSMPSAMRSRPCRWAASRPTTPASAYFNSPAIEVVLMIFMVIAAINFSTHFVAIRRGDPGAYRRDPEARWVVIWLAVSILMLTAVVHHAGHVRQLRRRAAACGLHDHLHGHHHRLRHRRLFATGRCSRRCGCCS